MSQTGNNNSSTVHKHGDPNTCTCPHCWHVFKFEETLYVARDPKLMGDAVLGPSASARFKPTRFSPDGHAIDAGGFRCIEMACPRCHLEIPRGLAEFASFFLSIVGSPSSGKSVFLGATVWHLRNVLAKNFGINFADLEPNLNAIIHTYESTLFFPRDPSQLAYIAKTQQQGDLYDRVTLDGSETLLPKPFIFSIRPQRHHPDVAHKALHRSMVLYDNAGEHFQPSQDTASQPGTMHMARSECLMFVYDPTQDPRFRAKLKESRDPQLQSKFRVERQDVIFAETAKRVRTHLGIPPGKKHSKWIIVVVNKSDVWRHLLKLPINDEPFISDPRLPVAALDLAHIDDVSFSTKCLLEDVCREVPSQIEEFGGTNVIYIPVSALGQSPTHNSETGALEVVPENINPHWVTIPFLFALSRIGIIYRGRPPAPRGTPAAEVVGHSDGLIHCKLPGQRMIFVPDRMAGQLIHHPVTGEPFYVPKSAPPNVPPPATPPQTPPQTPPPAGA